MKHSYKKVGANLGAAEIPGAIRPKRPIESAHIVKSGACGTTFLDISGVVCALSLNHMTKRVVYLPNGG